MNPNVKRFVAGAVVIALLWAVTAFTGADDTSTDASQSGSEISTEATVAAQGQADDAGPEEAVVSEEAPGQEEAAGADDATDAEASSARFSDLPIIAPGELPIEAIDTLGRIASGGPYPYSKDDSTFQNREAILPDQPQGHYREYTVDTPGESDRGARRIVAGADGALFYTDDHYDSFREIVLDR